ncbi:hypothetical protein SAMN05421805_120103 [Saccharopolyspora antimicrobica]|uniref:Uncharacterized protein n=1 Tax=Saccharopolyspora antimicrobica TaxID=455193 RepID=A0A1I5J0P9_9PSEU|nr:hypothetical protein [Saccharopolyspora antimicrobica]RKT83815.1 hypothetical protein ATL45_2109 [Saccharopolyspora antimicrobica]SFO65951.1 hypothetical protein SAMN05421805_120103 [Saccharopolyspora antimicrobica]
MVRQKEDPQDEPDEKDSDEEKSKKIEIKPAQVAGAATASVTAAFLGSKLGVAGTVIGAAMTSVIITVGGALYQRSFESAREKALHAAVKAKRATRAHARQLAAEARGAAKVQDESTRLLSSEATRRIRVESGMHWPGGEQVVDSEGTRKIDESTMLLAAEKAEAPVSPPVDRRKRRMRWAMAAATCAVAFVLSMLVVTGFEGITGRPLSGGESGTTLGKVLDREPRKEVAPPADEVEKPVQTRTREPVPTTEVRPTQEPTRQPTPESPQPSQQPTQSPSTEQTPTQQPTRTQEPNRPTPPTEQFQEQLRPE